MSTTIVSGCPLKPAVHGCPVASENCSGVEHMSNNDCRSSSFSRCTAGSDWTFDHASFSTSIPNVGTRKRR
eukprot:358356-Chlamydomonas_euryale.AAC.2